MWEYEKGCKKENRRRRKIEKPGGEVKRVNTLERKKSRKKKRRESGTE